MNMVITPKSNDYEPLTVAKLKMMGATGWYHIYHKKTIEKVLMNHGIVRYKCKYLAIERKFNSLMHSDENYLFCGGFYLFGHYSIDNKYILNQVVYRAKPMGFISGDTLEELKPYEDEAKKHELAFQYIDNDKNGVNDEENGGNRYEIGCCVKGTFSELFDLAALAEDYRRYLQYRSETKDYDLSFIGELAHRRLEEFLTFDYGREPKSYRDDIITGLILGYPIETTAAYFTDSVTHDS